MTTLQHCRSSTPKRYNSSHVVGGSGSVCHLLIRVRKLNLRVWPDKHRICCPQGTAPRPLHDVADSTKFQRGSVWQETLNDVDEVTLTLAVSPAAVGAEGRSLP
jgi:hypothetical protein